jgi:D-alanyl-D-alanine carboxypeptidase
MTIAGQRASATTHLSRRLMLMTGGTTLAAAALGTRQAHGHVTRQATPVPPDQPIPVEDQIAFEKIVNTSLAQTATPGALVGVWSPGQGTWLRAAGIGDVTTAMPMRLDDHVRIASNTKTFVATVILQLVDEHALDLDDRLEGFIAGIPNGREITLRQVLGMTAGIYDFVNDPVIAEGFNADPLLAFTPDDALEIIRASPPDFAPGERVQYSNSNYILLGMIAEQVGGRPIASLIQDRILLPLGMTETSFSTTPDLPAPFARGYDRGEPSEELRDVTFSNPDIAWASGAMVSTLTDLGIWAAGLAQGTLLTPALQHERLRFSSFETSPVAVGYGLGILSFNGLLGHNGGILGYSSWVMHDPDTGVSIVVVTNRGGNEGGTSDPIFIQLATHLFPERFAALSGATPAASATG